MSAQQTILLFFFFNDTATTEIYTLSLHDALPICEEGALEESAVAEAAGALEHRAEPLPVRDRVDTGSCDLTSQRHRPRRLELGAHGDLVERLQKEILALIAAPRFLEIDGHDLHRQIRPSARHFDALGVCLGQELVGRQELADAHHRRSEERRVGKECRSRWSPYH